LQSYKVTDLQIVITDTLIHWNFETL